MNSGSAPSFPIIFHARYADAGCRRLAVVLGSVTHTAAELLPPPPKQTRHRPPVLSRYRRCRHRFRGTRMRVPARIAFIITATDLRVVRETESRTGRRVSDSTRSRRRRRKIDVSSQIIILHRVRGNLSRRNYDFHRLWARATDAGRSPGNRCRASRTTRSRRRASGATHLSRRDYFISFFFLFFFFSYILFRRRCRSRRFTLNVIFHRESRGISETFPVSITV